MIIKFTFLCRVFTAMLPCLIEVMDKKKRIFALRTQWRNLVLPWYNKDILFLLYHNEDIFFWSWNNKVILFCPRTMKTFCHNKDILFCLDRCSTLCRTRCVWGSLRCTRRRGRTGPQGGGSPPYTSGRSRKLPTTRGPNRVSVRRTASELSL